MSLRRGSRARPPRSTGRALRRGGLGLVLGALGGWFAGLLKAPKPPKATQQ